MESYRRLLREVDRWFTVVQEANRENMACRRGCTFCCHGLFDVSLADALEVAAGLRTLSRADRREVGHRSAPIQRHLARELPHTLPPFLFDSLTDEQIDGLVERAGSPVCPLLDGNGECRIYEHRPLACRLEGVPMVDCKDGLFGDWCDLNFTRGITPAALESLRQDYYGLQETEAEQTLELSELLLGRRSARVTTFIPSVVIYYERFWKDRIEQPFA